ncbi:hypothetical protein EVAR_50016_1 [Eumeta japonica]|uniref:Uncharacterized protein n=1 Tax=Eumeta variegata TaxID=151549 RepID=A0A4C1YTQ1_EUMVA|nr:hypothetical protein EVAR_50016_1 [Eumeta japonica]
MNFAMVTYKIDAILKKVEQHQHIRSYGIAEELRIYYKTISTNLKKGKTINFDLFCQQLMRLKQEEMKKQPELFNR